MGQIINSINNISNICKEQHKARKKPTGKDDMKLSEDTTPDLVKHLAEKLEQSYGVINELVHVYEQYTILPKKKYEYNVDKAYKIDIDIEHEEETHGAGSGGGQRGQAGGGSRQG